MATYGQPVRTAVNQYAEATGIGASSETTVLSYVAAAAMVIQGFIVSGSTNMRFKLKVNGTAKGAWRTSVAERSGTVPYEDGGIAVSGGDTITVTAYHEEPNVSAGCETTVYGYTES